MIDDEVSYQWAVWWFLVFCLNLFSLCRWLKTQTIQERFLCIGVVPCVNVVSLCPCLCLSLKDIPSSRGPPDPISRVPWCVPITITWLTQFPLFRLLCLHLGLPIIPFSVLSARHWGGSPPRPIIASSPLSVVVLGTNLPFAPLKVIFGIGQICRCSEPQFLHLLKVIMDTSCPTALMVCLLCKWNNGGEISP